MALVAGIDSSTQSCKVVVRDLATGALQRSGRAPHPPGTEVDPDAWLAAAESAFDAAGGLTDVSAIAVGGQQHGMVTLDADGRPVRPALLWNDTRSAPDAAELVAELGAAAWADRVGSVPVASFTVTKLRWLARYEPDSLARTSAVCLPHDWLTWHLTGGDLSSLVTDRGDASGTGYWSPQDGAYTIDLLALATGRSDLHLPRVLEPQAPAGVAVSGRFAANADAVVAAGTGDNMAAALALGAAPGDVIVSVGTSGVVSVVSPIPVSDSSGNVAGFADATGNYLPLVCTLNAGLVIDAFRKLLGLNFTDFDELALDTQRAGRTALTLLPYLGGERTPNRPAATGVLSGITVDNLTSAQLACAAVDSIACSLADGMAAITACGIDTSRVLLVGGGAQLRSLQQALADALQREVVVPAPGEYVADGAAVQAAWALTGERPNWLQPTARRVRPGYADDLIARYRQLRDQTGRDGWPQ